ncbi:MAG: putative methyltransferase [Candidatus Brocadiaceae bacterium]|nr:putative methyltransferase [Candidatus Brocadiaceae bacterium]
MRINPYKEPDNVINGVVVTFVDITALKQLEMLQQESLHFMKSILDTVREPLIVLDAELRVVSASQAFCQMFQEVPDTIEKQRFSELSNRQWDIPALLKRLKNVLTKNQYFNNYRIEHDFPQIGRKVLLLSARPLTRTVPGVPMIFLAMQDISERDKKS